jgi:integrase
MYLVKRNKYYHIYFRDASGRLKTISTKKGTKRDAMKVLQEMESHQIPRSNLPQITFDEFVNRYMELDRINRSHTYVEQFKYAFRELKIEVKNKLLSEINHNDIEKMVNRRRAEGKNTSTNTFITCIKSAFNRAVDWELLETNPAAKIKKKKLPKNHPIFITEEEFNKLIKLEKNLLTKSAYIIAFYSGYRVSELLNIRWKDVDFANNKICIRNHQHHNTKSLLHRDIPIHPKVKQVIESLPRINEFVLQGYYNRRRLSGKFKEIVKKCDEINQEMKFHGLRHSFASNLVRKGISLYIVQQLLGHSDSSITQIYSHLKNESLNEAIKMLN